ncbi:hypothetical protein NQ080_12590 [Enterococcus faecium]|uniref:hypothetical protein n=1 Tax=Enterococcus faecium TaxID=1352 RepID=UPI0005067895|nr:hypothetical protein [Enterococcus faecium]KFO17979.1 hypothetical protein L232_0100310 [Enterococcus faecium UC7267]KGK77825.1 hypothetical protein LK25_01035 [Enterococcus faecium]MCR9049896.1 hypothetical protein [Enterococcus faecium]
MRYFLGIVFSLLSLWQFIVFKRAYTQLKQNGDKDTSPFIMLGLWSGLLFVIVFFVIAINCFFADFSSFM